jgi:hypothetical protein
MSRYRVGSSARIRARPALIYAAIADYRQQHPHIVPPEDFPRLAAWNEHQRPLDSRNS